MKAIASLADQIEIRHGGFHHQHIRALFQVELHFVHGFAAVGGVHLIAAAIAKLRRRFSSFAKWSVKYRSEFRRIRENWRFVEAVGV